VLSRQEEQAERRKTLRQDLSVQRQQREREERRGTFAPDQSIPRQGTTLTAMTTPTGR
jgi:hypothetical protein